MKLEDDECPFYIDEFKRHESDLLLKAVSISEDKIVGLFTVPFRTQFNELVYAVYDKDKLRFIQLEVAKDEHINIIPL